MSNEYQLLLVSIVSPEQINYPRLQAILDTATDWFRFSPTNFMIWTDKGSHYWAQFLHGPGELARVSFVVYTVNIGERQGWMPKEFWDWLDKIKPSGYGTLNTLAQLGKTQKHE